MKIILNELSVWWFRASCLLIGGLALLVISAAANNRWRIRRTELLPISLCALFNICAWNLLSAYGVSIMPAGRASIIAFTMPLWATIFACLLLNEKISPSKSLGLVLGLTGLAVLIGPDLVIFNQAPLGAIFMLAAAVTWGLGTVLLKKGDWDIPIASHVAWQLLLSAIPVGIGAVLLEPVPDVTSLSPPAIIALLYIYAFPITFSQWAYMKVVNMLPASIAAIGTLLVPVIGVYSSHFILSEPVGLRALTALALVCTGLLCVLVLPGLSSLPKDR